ncbi:broad specificity phosphatase PhoE [Bradyrhizobium elkanii]
MDRETRLWLIRHAPVDGPRGVIHAPDAPADLSDAAAFASLQVRLPAHARAVCSPARRTRETAVKLGLTATEDDAFREQDFGDWTGRRHSEIEAELGAAAYRAFWQSPGSNRPAARRKLCRSDRAGAGRARAPAGRRRRTGRAFRYHPRDPCDRARACAGARAALRHRSAVADADRPAAECLARGRGERALIAR